MKLSPTRRPASASSVMPSYRRTAAYIGNSFAPRFLWTAWADPVSVGGLPIAGVLDTAITAGLLGGSRHISTPAVRERHFAGVEWVDADDTGCGPLTPISTNAARTRFRTSLGVDLGLVEAGGFADEIGLRPGDILLQLGAG